MRWVPLFLLFLLSAPISAEKLRIGYDITQFGRYNKKDVQLTLSVWLQEMVRGTPNTIESFAYHDLDVMAKDFKDDKINIASTSSLNFVKYFDRELLDDGFAATDGLSDTHRLLLITRGDSHIKNWQDMKDATIFALEGSDIARLYVDTELLQRRLSNGLLWRGADTYQQALLKLFFSKGDAAIVTQKAFDLAAEMNPQIRQKLKVFDESTMTELIPSYFRKGMDKDIKENIIEITLALTESVRGRQILAIFRSDSIDTITVDSLKPIAKAYGAYLRLIKEKDNKHAKKHSSTR